MTNDRFFIVARRLIFRRAETGDRKSDNPGEALLKGGAQTNVNNSNDDGSNRDGNLAVRKTLI